MNPTGTLKVVSQLLDLPIKDRDDRWCGVVDDVEFSGGAGKDARLEALLVGPGAYRTRLPAWAFWLVRLFAGDRIARVPVEQIETVGSAVELKCRAEDVKLHAVENKVRRWIPRGGAL